MNTTTITPMSDRAAMALHFMAGVGPAPEGDASAAFAELLRLGLVRELPDAAEGEDPYPITEAGVRELAARREAAEATLVDVERARCLDIVDAVASVAASRVPEWLPKEIRRRILGEPEETLASHRAAVNQRAIDYYLLTGKRQNA